MRISIDQRFQLLYNWSNRDLGWQWGLSDNQTDNTHCGIAPSQVEMLEEAIRVMKEWQKDYGY